MYWYSKNPSMQAKKSNRTFGIQKTLPCKQKKATELSAMCQITRVKKHLSYYIATMRKTKSGENKKDNR